MTPEVMPQGRSFRGAWQYYAHDKREAGEEELYSRERVAFTHTENLPTADPDKAWKCMVWTAKNQAALKKATGQKMTGRKMQKPVYTYVLSWHPEEAPTRQEMIAAGRETLKVLKLEGHEVLMVAHKDRPHPHLHLIVNRVHPETGMDGDLSKDFLKLSTWAEAYDKSRGKDYAPQRAINNELRRNGEYVRGSKPKKKRSDPDRQATAPEKAREEADRKKQADLSRISERHERELAQLSGTVEARLTARKAQIKETYRARWDKLYERQGAEKEQGSQTRRSILDSFKGWVSRRLEKTGVFVPFWLETSKGQAATAQTLDRKHKTERGELAKQYRTDLKAAVGEIKDAHRLSLRVIEMRQVGSGRTQDKAPAPPSREQFLKAVIDLQKNTPTANENRVEEQKRKRDREREPGPEF